MIQIDADDGQYDIKNNFNEVLTALEQQCVDKIDSCQDAPGTTKRHCLFIFDWFCHGYLRRVINLAEQYSKAINEREIIAAAILGRALVETVAQFHHLLKKVESNLRLKDFPQVYHLIASFTLGGNHGYNNKDDQNLKSLHINNALDTIDKTYKKVTETHSWLSEFSHPNAHGTALTFSGIDKKNGDVKFYKSGRPDMPPTPMLDAAVWFPIFQEDWNTLPKLRELILSNWEHSEKVCDLFEGKVQN